ncbi:MAG: elongation factor 4 [Elusimicrobia bacterium]|nr:elongation factor 4 [Elusimicrobiota bacterium]
MTSNIRNFSIIAHIDHGKSTLADRLLEDTQTIPLRMMREQMLDDMDLERERGITIKAKAVRMVYRNHVLNLIDTPGHVDFSYEVSRALAACEGALLVVDASQGVEAQTLANAHLAQRLGLCIIPVINKVDLPSADVAGTVAQIREILKIETPCLEVSAKEGRGIHEVLEAIVRDIPAPQGSPSSPVSTLIFDSVYDPYKGVVLYIKVVEGTVRSGQMLKMFSSGFAFRVDEVGHLTPSLKKGTELMAGDVGYLIGGIKEVHQVRVGDTLMEEGRPLPAALPGYREAQPVVFAGFYPMNPADYPALKMALEKLNLSDSSFSYQAESSQALGFGYRIGFLGLLHLDIVKERLEREFNLTLIATSPNVVYRVRTKKDGWMEVDSPAKFPHYGDIEEVEEPYVRVTIVLPVMYLNPVMNLLKERRGEHRRVETLSNQRMIVEHDVPLAEIILDFYDKLKSVSKGYASFDYEPQGTRLSDLVRGEILIHGEPVDAFSLVGHRSRMQSRVRALCEKLKELIPRQMFEVAIQGRVEGKIVARETLPAVRKDVLAKCYGGDITRKRKLLQKQKEGKKKMKSLGNVEIPQEAFMAVLKLSE